MSPIDGQKELLFDYIYERMDDQEIRERVRESVFNEWNKDNNLVKDLWETLQADDEFKRERIYSEIENRKEEIT
tara:strand:+ start:4369 stop:4590 length:222 start_codon:yes stop_codon:yes gene_type:complete